MDSLVEVRPGRRLNVCIHNRKIGTIPSVEDEKTPTPLLFFIHGSMASTEAFAPIFASFEDHCDILMFDALGCGKSEKRLEDDAYTTHELSQDVIQLFNQHASKDTTPVILVGHSYGTAQVARLLSHLKRENQSHQVKGTILLGGIDSLPSGGHPIFQYPVCMLSLLQRHMSQTFVQLALSPHADGELRDKCFQQSMRNSMTVCKHFYTQFEWATVDDWHALADLKVLMLHGEHDQITPMDGAQKLHDLLRANGTQVRFHVVEKAGHQLCDEAPSVVVGHINTFLAEDCGLSRP
jgi:pimeloyl-ACP methyl ester carboxylesterase